MSLRGLTSINRTPELTSIQRSAKRHHRLVAMSLVTAVILGMSVPVASASAATGSLSSIASWSSTHHMTSYQEGSARVDYAGRWIGAAYAGYRGPCKGKR